MNKSFQEKLNKLSGNKYEEYLDFQKKESFWWSFFWWIFSLVLFVSYSLLSFFIFIEISIDSIGCFGLIFIYVSLGLVIMIFDGSFDEHYTKIFNFLFHKTPTYTKIKQLRNHFELIEMEIEEEAISILSKIEVESRKRLKENESTNYDLRLKRKWKPDYENKLAVVERNCRLNSEALNIFDETIQFIKFDYSKLKLFKNFRSELSNPFQHYSWLLNKIDNLYGQNLSSKQTSATASNKKKNIASNNKSSSQNSHIEINKKTAKNNDNFLDTENSLIENKPNTIFSEIRKEINYTSKNHIELPKSSIQNESQNYKQSELDFDNTKINLKRSDETPNKRKTLNYEPIIKASPEFYKQLADKKMEIGFKGELLVLEYERQRIIEEGENPKNKIRHISVEDGDGFGYDICSFENGKEIYIEVKTTTGSFWSNLFFTQNEYSKMDKYGEQYYLYRVCRFDLESNQGELFIFKGKDFIIKYFNFESKVYVLTEKKNQI